MHCLPVPGVPIGEGWLYEIKWEGCRVIGCKLGRSMHLFSPDGECLDEQFPEMVQALAGLRCRSAIIDGEIIAWNEDGQPSLEELQKEGPRMLHMAAFDLVMLEGRDLRNRPLMIRRAALNAILPPEDSSMLSFSRELQGDPDRLIERAKLLHIEGIIAKRRDSLYESGARTGSWVKCRGELERTFVIGGYIPGENGFEELILGEPARGRLRFVCRLRAGFVPASQRKVLHAIEGLERDSCPFVNAPETNPDPVARTLDSATMARCRWVTPKVSVDVAFAGWSDQRHLRQARFERLPDVCGTFPK
jgi:bifunctional non-homologous end joining protein LigD